MTPEVVAAIVGFLERGNYRLVSAKAAGISGSTFSEWYATGKHDHEKREDTPYRDFYRSVNAAEAKAEAGVVERLMQAAQTDVRAMSFWLERKHSTRWGRKDKSEVTGKGGGPIAIETTTADAASKLKAALVRRVDGEAGRIDDATDE